MKTTINTDAISQLCDAAMLAGAHYARTHKIQLSDGPRCERYLNALRPMLKAILHKTLNDAKEAPQMIGLLAESMKAEFVAAGIEAARQAVEFEPVE